LTAEELGESAIIRIVAE